MCRYKQTSSSIGEAQCFYVGTSEALEEAADRLAKASVLGVDVEHNHLRSYRGMVCLLQLHAGDRIPRKPDSKLCKPSHTALLISGLQFVFHVRGLQHAADG